MDSNSEIQGYDVYSMLHFHRKFFSSVTPAYPVKGKAQEGERRLRRKEEKETARVTKP